MAWEEKKWRIQLRLASVVWWSSRGDEGLLLLLAVNGFCGVHACVQGVKRRVRDVCVSVHACVQEVRGR